VTPPGDRTAPVLSTELETMAFPDGAALRRWVRRRTRRHLHGVWALVGDVYSVLLTLIVVVTILAPYLRRVVVTPPGSAVGAGALGGFATVGLDPGWGLLALLMLLVAVGVGSLGRLGPLFLRPHEAVDDAGEVRWWVASDLGELVTGRALAPDHVLGIGGAGLTLAGLTPRTPVSTALDLGCGCGIQTLYLLRHAEHVVATDISERALAFTAFNAALAGVSVIDGPRPGADAGSAGRLELRLGSLLEPVAGRRFDLIASNPPFVLTPPAVREAGLPLMEYRDAGGPVLPALVAGLGEHLEPGGAAVMLGNWEHYGADSWRDAVSAWIPEELDAWVIEREVQDPVEYATMWLRDGGLTPERHAETFDAALGAWIGDFEARGVEGIGFGYLIVHRPESPRGPWRLLEEVSTSGQGVLGPHVAEVLRTRELLSGLDDDAVAALRPVLAPDVTEERHFVPGASEPTVILLRQGGGLGRTVQASTAVAALAGVADGELSVGQIASAVASLTEVDADALRAELVEAVRRLATHGFLGLDSTLH